MVKCLPTMQKTRVSIPGSGRSPGEGNSNPLQYSCLENPMDGGALVGYSPWGHKELDMTERLHFSLFFFFFSFKDVTKFLAMRSNSPKREDGK